MELCRLRAVCTFALYALHARFVFSGSDRCLQAGKHEEASRLLDRSLAICKSAYGPEHPMVATVLNNLAESSRELVRSTDRGGWWWLGGCGWVGG